MDVIRGSFVDRDLVTPEHISMLTLVIEPSKFFPFQQTRKFQVFKAIDEGYIVPRNWGQHTFEVIQHFSPNQNLEYIDRLDFCGTLQDIQLTAAQKFIQQIQYEGGGVLSLATGMGKTVIALFIACQIKFKTLIVVHKQVLMTQWIERIKQFIPFARIGSIQQKNVNTSHCDIIVAMLQSVAMHNYPPEIFDDIGFAIFDEVHVIPTPVFSNALFKLQHIPYLLGLSATPKRYDGLSCIFHWFLGPTCFEYNLQNKNNIYVYVVKFIFTQLYIPKTKQGYINYSAVISLLSNLQTRNSLIASHISSFVTKKYRVLVLSDRRQHCVLLQESLSTFNISSGLFLGGMKESELSASTNCNVIFSTYAMAKEGLDLPNYDALVLATPRSDVVQACGRVLHSKTEHNPIIIDIVDDWSLGKSQYNKRLKYYNQSGFTVKYL